MFEFAHNSTEHSDIFLDTYNGGSSVTPSSVLNPASLTGGNGLLLKRRASDNFFEHSHVNNTASHEWTTNPSGGDGGAAAPPSSKRPHHSILFNNHLQSLAYGTNPTAHSASFFDYHHLGTGSFSAAAAAAASANHNGEHLFFGEKSSSNYRDERDHRANVLSASAAELFSHRSRNGGAPGLLNGVGGGSHQSHNGTGGGAGERGVSLNNSNTNNSSSHNGSSTTGGGDEEWKNIHTMLNCISAMVEKTKRAITILQQRGVDSQQSYQESALQEMKRLTDEKVADFKRNAEEAVNQVKRQAVIEIQRAVAVAENRAVEIVAQERIKMEKLFSDINSGVAGGGIGKAVAVARESNGNQDSQPPPDVIGAENNSNVSE